MRVQFLTIESLWFFSSHYVSFHLFFWSIVFHCFCIQSLILKKREEAKSESSKAWSQKLSFNAFNASRCNAREPFFLCHKNCTLFLLSNTIWKSEYCLTLSKMKSNWFLMTSIQCLVDAPYINLILLLSNDVHCFALMHC